MTLHRLLSYSPAGERFRHHERNPLAERLVVVDESSMIDLQLADHLLRSLPAGGRLVLLGDARQLPAVDAGAVLRDLVAAPAVAPRVARLTRSFRMDSADPAGSRILAFAERVATGDLGPLAESLVVRTTADELTFAGPELLPAPPNGPADLLARWWEARVATIPGWPAVTREWPVDGDALIPDAAATMAPLLGGLEASRLLCVTRGWSAGRGVAAVNAWCRARLLATTSSRGRRRPTPHDLQPGEPVLVTRNDYGRGLYNGDQGIVATVREPGAEPQLAAVFRRGDGFRAVPLAALRGRLEAAWATTVHKAQGSEHGVVALLLPVEPTRLLTRELLYTAVTRARQGVTLLGDEGTLRHAAATASERWSGLPEALGAAPPDGATAAPTGAGPRGEGNRRDAPKASPPGQLGLPF